MIAAIYARFSSESQKEQSITAQVRLGKDYCTKHNHSIYKIYVDRALTARTDERPDFLNMMNDAQLGLFDIVIVYDVERFARNRYDSAYYKLILRKAGIKLIYLTVELDDSPESVILESNLEGMAEYYSLKLSRDTKRGHRENALQAKHIGGKPPLGYDVTPDKNYEINPAEAIIVSKIFKDYALGKSLTSICEELNSAGYKTKRGGAFGKNSLHDLLKNTKYIGQYIMGKSTGNFYGKRINRKQDPNAIVLDNAIPAIVPMEIWDKVQERFKKRSMPKRSKEIYILSGLVHCPSCGGTLVGNRHSVADKVYSYYRCNKAERTGQCKKTKYPKNKLEDLVLKQVLPLIFSPGGAKNFIRAVNKKMALFAEESLSHIKTLSRERKSAQTKIESLLRIIETGNAPQSVIDRIRTNEDQIIFIDQQLDNIESKMKKYTLSEAALLEIFESLQNTKEPAALKLLAQTLIKKVTIDTEKNTANIELSISDKHFGLRLVTRRGIEPLISP